MSTASSSTLTIRQAEPKELPRCALLLAQAMYAPQTRGQTNELTRLELKDLEARYGETMGRRKYPACLLVAEEDQEFVGTVGLDCQYLSLQDKKLKPFKPQRADADKGDNEIAIVLANLVVRPDRRKKGIAKKLMTAAEAYVREEAAAAGLQPAIHLLVDSENAPAQALYKKLGYKLLFTDEFATCVVAGEYNLKTQDCVNYCFKKTLTKGGGGAGGAGGLGAFFGSLFGGNK